MPVDLKQAPAAAPRLTVLMYGRGSEAAVRDKGLFHVLRQPDLQSAGVVRNVFVLVAATELPHVSEFVSAVNRRNQLRALIVSGDVEGSLIPQMFVRAHLNIMRNTIVHSDVSVPRRLLTAWARNAQEQLIAVASVSANRLFVLSCAMRQYEVAFDEMPALKLIPEEERPKFRVDEDGSYIHWPGSDIHVDLDAIRSAKDPKAHALAAALKAQHDERFGSAIAKLRTARGLRQSDIEGLSERQVRRIEKGEGTRAGALQCLAASHGLSLDEYLQAISEVLAGPNGASPAPR
jgi:hypothetical protein